MTTECGVLQAACRAGNLDLVEDELSKNADVNGVDAFGRTPLLCLFIGLFAGWYNDRDICHQIAALLVYNGAKLGHYDTHAIFYAVSCAKLETVKLLVYWANGDLSYAPENQDSCLHRAVMTTQPGVLQFVAGVFKVRNWSLNLRNQFGDTPLLKASRPKIQNHEAIEILLNLEADCSITDRRGQTSFDLLLQGRPNGNLASLYYKRGVDILHRNSTALLYAVAQESPWMTLIVEAIADRESQGKEIVGINKAMFDMFPKPRFYLDLYRERLRARKLGVRESFRIHSYT